MTQRPHTGTFRAVAWALLCLACGVCLPSLAVAQSPILGSALSWTWEQGTGDPADEFRLKCGESPGNYTRTIALASGLRSTLIPGELLTGGTWYCVLVASNTAGESGPTNEVVFETPRVRRAIQFRHGP